MKFRRSKLPKFIPIVSLLILLVLGPIVFSFLQNARGVEAAWVDDNFSYRNAIPISSHTAAENNVYVTVTLDTSASGQFQSDCGDLRFTTVGGDILPYYIVSGCVSASTVVHVFFKSMPAGAQTIYYYYGNPSAANGFSSSDFSTQAANYAVGTIGSQEKGGAPIAYWKFDDGTGTNAQDSSQNNNDGTITGATWQTEDQCTSSKCLKFDGSTSVINMGDQSILESFDTLAVGAWVRLNSLPPSANYFIAGKEGVYKIDVNTNGTLRFLTGNNWGGAILTTVSVLSTNKWYFVMATYDGTTKKIFIDGKQDTNTVTTSGSVSSNTKRVSVGAYDSGASFTNFLNGFIDDVKIYNYARTAAQIKSDFKSRGAAKGTSVGLGSKISDLGSLSNGLVGYWKMDEVSGAGSTLADSSGNSNTGTAVLWGGGNTSTDSAHVAGKFGNSFSFDGGDDNVTVTDVASLQAGATMTVSTWFKLNATASDKRFVDKTNNGTGYALVANSTTPRFITGNGSTYDNLDGTTTLTTGTWYHMVGTVENGTKRIYVNGNLENTASITFNGVGTGVNFRIGARAAAQAVNASIDEIRLYNRALSPREVRDLYNWAPGPISYFPMEESTGTTTTDTSGGLVGTLTSGPTWTSGKYGKGIDFESTNSQYITMTTGSIYNTAKSGLTVEMWYKKESSGGYLIANSGGYVYLLGSGNNIVGYVYPGGATTCTTSGITVGVGEWHHVSLTWDSVTLKVFIDGNLGCTSTTTPGSITTMANEWRIGDRPASSGLLDGVVDDVRIYNYARTQKQIVEDMNAGHPVGGSPIGSQVGYWKFDEGYGTTPKDSSSYGLNGTVNGSVGWSNDGKYGKALDFDGSTGYVSFATQPVNWSSRNRTISMWVRPESSDLSGVHDLLVGYDTSYTYSRMRLRYSSAQINFQYIVYPTPITVTMTSSTTLIAGSWYYVTVSWDDTKYYLYINGKQESTYSNSSVSTDNVTLTTLGSNQDTGDPATYSYGLIDEVKIYYAALTEDEIKLDYNRGQAMVLGSTGDASSSAGAIYCLPGDTATCTPPVGEWNFEERSGQTVNDISGNGYSGTLGANSSVASDDPTWTDGILGKALKYDGVDDYTDLGNPTGLNIGTGAFTVEAWVYNTMTVANNTFMDWISKGGYSDGLELRFVVGGTGTKAIDGWIGGSSVGGNYDFQTNKWYHLVFTRDGSGNWVEYINGSKQFNGTNSNTLGADNWRIGRGKVGREFYWKGSIDDVRIYNYARSAAQVAWDYNQGKPVAQWKMDECQGGSVFDASGNGNTGTITIGATGTQTAVGTCTTSGTAWYNGVTGKYNSSLKFDGTDDYMTRNMTVSASDGTVAFWVKDFATGAGPYLFRSDANIRTYVGVESASTIYFYKGNPAVALSSTPSLTASNWNHIVLKWWTTGSTQYAEAYANGKSTGTPVTFLDSSAGSYITVAGFNQSGTQNAAGQIDDVRIYNYALTASQVKSLFNGGSAIRFGPTTGSP